MIDAVEKHNGLIRGDVRSFSMHNFDMRKCIEPLRVVAFPVSLMINSVVQMWRLTCKCCETFSC